MKEKVKLPTPKGMEFIYHNIGACGTGFIEYLGSSAWRWTTNKNQYGMSFLFEKESERKTEQELLYHFWRVLGAA